MIPQLLFVTGGGNSEAIVTRLQKSKRNTHFTEIFLSGVHITEEVLEALLDVLSIKEWEGIHMGQCTGFMQQLISKSCAHVQKLSLLCDFDPLQPSWCRSLAKGLSASNCRLQKLMLRVQLSRELALALCEGLPKSHVEELVLPISDSTLEYVELLASALNRCTSLKRLKWNRHDLVSQIDPCQLVTLCQSLEHHPSLQDLSIQGSSCSPPGIQAIAKHVLPVLSKLDLSNHRFGGDRLIGIPDLATALGTSKLEFLSLSGHWISEQDIEALATALTQNTSLQELCLTNCHLSDASIQIFAERLPQMKHLKYLWLHDNPFQKEGALALVDAMQDNCELEQMILPRGRGLDPMQRQLELFLVLNRAGRRLLRHHHRVPLALWPQVLDRANKAKKDSYFASSTVYIDAIFHLLKGPALFER